MMEEDMSGGVGSSGGGFLTLRVCRRAAHQSMKWDVTLNDIYDIEPTVAHVGHGGQPHILFLNNI